MAALKGDNPVEQLREKLARDARWRVRERYFALRIVPVLLVWALLMAAATVAAGGLISLGVALTTYFSGAVLLVIWLARRARRSADERELGSTSVGVAGTSQCGLCRRTHRGIGGQRYCMVATGARFPAGDCASIWRL